MTTIEWTQMPGYKGETWNPLRGCSHVSPGCTNCYAATMAHRYSGKDKYGKPLPYEGLTRMTPQGARWTGEVRLVPEMLEAPLHWREPRMVFVNSMSDLFHESVPDWFIAAVFAVMALRPQHIFQVLTKRPERMAAWFAETGKDPASVLADAAERFLGRNDEAECALANYINGWSRWRDMPDDGNPLNGTVRRWPLPNVWLGVSVENQKTADERIPYLLQVPAAVRFLSMEPLLELVDLTRINYDNTVMIDAINGLHGWPIPHADSPKVDWVIAGGESGPKARPMHPDWVRSIRDQCEAAKVPFFFKQWGEWVRPSQMTAHTWQQVDMAINLGQRNDDPVRVGKKKAGALLDSREWREWPETYRKEERA